MFQTSAGWMAASCSDAGLTGLTFPEQDKSKCARLLLTMLDQNCRVNQPPGPGDKMSHLGKALDEYFSGRCKKLDFAVDWSIYSPFQRDILKVVKEIPHGTLLTYGQVAAMAGYPRASRAAGGALRANRVPLVIPCHRVVQRDGSPGGFGGRPWMKIRLLDLEGVKPGPNGRYMIQNSEVRMRKRFIFSSILNSDSLIPIHEK